MRHVPLERQVGLKTQSENISMTTVLAEGDAMALWVLCATDFAAECSCEVRSDAALSGTVRTSSEPSGCGGERRGRRFRLRTGLRDFLRVSEAMRCQFCLLCAHAFLICFGVAQRRANRRRFSAVQRPKGARLSAMLESGWLMRPLKNGRLCR